MSEDYLWDGTGAPDPDVERLGRLLGRLRTKAEAPAMPRDALPGSDPQFGSDPVISRRSSIRRDTTYIGVRFLGPALAAAAAIVAMVGLLSQIAAPGPAWSVAAPAATPLIRSHTTAAHRRPAVGQTLVTDASSRARMEVSDMAGDVDEARVRRRAAAVIVWRSSGTHAVITAPAGQFVVNTPSATATDLGCIYTLHVNDAGTGLLTVEAGWVAFEERGHESFVPAGASARTDPRVGAGTPRYDDAEPVFREALDEVDGGRDAAARAAALREVIAHARTRDAMTLWHLIPRVGLAERGAVVDALAARVPMPPAVTREAVLRSIARRSISGGTRSGSTRRTGGANGSGRYRREVISRTRTATGLPSFMPGLNAQSFIALTAFTSRP